MDTKGLLFFNDHQLFFFSSADRCLEGGQRVSDSRIFRRDAERRRAIKHNQSKLKPRDKESSSSVGARLLRENEDAEDAAPATEVG